MTFRNKNKKLLTNRSCPHWLFHNISSVSCFSQIVKCPMIPGQGALLYVFPNNLCILSKNNYVQESTCTVLCIHLYYLDNSIAMSFVQLTCIKQTLTCQSSTTGTRTSKHSQPLSLLLLTRLLLCTVAAVS